jgi:hypothetical protein
MTPDARCQFLTFGNNWQLPHRWVGDKYGRTLGNCHCLSPSRGRYRREERSVTTQTTCRSCGASIYWLRHEVTGKAAPIDAVSREGGNVEIDLERGAYRIVPATCGEPAHTNHFATCPQQAAWRKTGRSGQGVA